MLVIAATLTLTTTSSATAPWDVTNGAGQSIAIDDTSVYWIDGGRLVTSKIEGHPERLPHTKVLRVSAGGGHYAFSTLTTKRSGRVQILTRKVFRSVNGGKPRRLTTTTEYFRSGLYCGAGVGIWGLDSGGKLLFHRTSNKRKKRCFRTYRTQFYTAGTSRTAKPTPVFRTGESLVGAQGTRVATKAKSGGKTLLRVTDFSKKINGKTAKGSIQPLALPNRFVPAWATFDANGNVVVTAEGRENGATLRSAFVDRIPLNKNSEQWRYRACGRSIVRWLDEAITGGKQAAIEVVKNDLDPQSEGFQTVLASTPGSIRALTCDGQRVAYVLADSSATKAAAKVHVRNIDRTPPVVTITSPASGSKTTASSTQLNFMASDGATPSEKLRCSVSINGFTKEVQAGSKSVIVDLAVKNNSLQVTCADGVGLKGMSAVVTVKRFRPLRITSPVNGASVSKNDVTIAFEGQDDARFTWTATRKPCSPGLFTVCTWSFTRRLGSDGDLSFKVSPGDLVEGSSYVLVAEYLDKSERSPEVTFTVK